jgi:hypothetical protein
MMKQFKRLNRFTTLPVLLDMLKRNKLVLLDPTSWEDKNDSEILIEYKKRNNIRTLRALCFSHGDETIHHWKTFSDGISGCCIEFDAKKLIPLLDTYDDIRFDAVEYKKIKDLGDGTIDINRIPFTKRWPYRCEEEFRIIWEGQTETPYYEIDFDLQMINKITISQHMPDQVYSTIREYLKSAFKNPDQRINRSTIYHNRIWIGKFRKA